LKEMQEVGFEPTNS